jgi:hypothetical protein
MLETRGTITSGHDAYLKGLDPASPALEPLGLSPETLKDWRAGYSKGGVLRGKLAIALCDRAGNILGFFGRSLEDVSLTFPKEVDPHDVIFGQDHICGDEVARELKREIKKRDEPYSMEDNHA